VSGRLDQDVLSTLPSLGARDARQSSSLTGYLSVLRASQ
jgi:hypothetical protein